MNLIRRFLAALFLVALSTIGTSTFAQTSYSIPVGWSLLGNAGATSIDVANTFADAAKFMSVWKWNSTTNKWALYAPSMSASALASYNQSKGFETLTSIAAKEGFWVNAATPVIFYGPLATPPSPGTPPVTLNLLESDLKLGWNLVASADNKTASQLNAGLASSLAANSKAINAIWAWNGTTGKWKFFAPSLDALGGTALSDYVASHDLEAFSLPISSDSGYWVDLSANKTSNRNLARLDANGHYYETYSARAIAPMDALTAATTHSYLGLQGYLATITTAEENSFVGTLVAKVPTSDLGGYLFGASDSEVDGTWIWLNGPERGNKLTYFAWDPRSSEPNGYFNGRREDYVAIGSDGKWVDLPATGYAGVGGYIVEYGGMPATYTLSGTISGLASGSQVTLLNNAANPLVVTTNGVFTFSTAIAYGGSYSVTVNAQPTGQTCTTSNGSGIGVTTTISNISVTCTTYPTSLSISVPGNAGPWNVSFNPTMPYGGGAANTSAKSIDLQQNSIQVDQKISLQCTGGATVWITPTAVGDMGNCDGIPNLSMLIPFHANHPSLYIPGFNTITPYKGMKLVGSFANSHGTIIGNPFIIDSIGINLITPSGATQILLGLDDDYFYDNSGQLSVIARF
jgi:hypothetical protein